MSVVLSQLRQSRSKNENVEEVVKLIIQDVKENGDFALKRYNVEFDGVELESLKFSKKEIKEAYNKLDDSVIKALKVAKANMEKFHNQNITFKDSELETSPGVKLWREFRPIEKVGLYIPGGTAAYPSTLLMNAIPAKIAGCKKIVMCTPVGSEGTCNPAILVAADLCGISEIFKVGGAQAIAAMAYGTQTIPRVYKIFGPGNQYVTTAKVLVYGQVAIDMPAGPSELMVMADANTDASWVAADLLSQLEHGVDSQVVLITDSESFGEKVVDQIQIQTEELLRKEIIEESSKKSFVLIVDSWQQASELANEYAPEHLQIMLEGLEEEILGKINNVGSVFLGKYTTESLGDYATGANHTLPTSGYAKMFAPLSVESFGKKIQIQQVSAEGIENLRETVEILAEAEGLEGHARSVSIRFSGPSQTPTLPGAG